MGFEPAYKAPPLRIKFWPTGGTADTYALRASAFERLGSNPRWATNFNKNHTNMAVKTVNFQVGNWATYDADKNNDT